MAKTFTAGDKVFAKVRGYPAWPARVEGLADNTPNKAKYHVFFYGTSETAVCKVEDLYHFEEHKEKYGKPLKRKGFNEALEQIQGLAPVPEPVARREKTSADDGDSDVEGNLVIDENPAKAGEEIKKKAVKRKRDSDGTTEDGDRRPSNGSAVRKRASLPPQKRSKRDSLAARDLVTSGAMPATPDGKAVDGGPSSPNKPEIVSRSGRKIKPKKFADEETFDGGLVSPEGTPVGKALDGTRRRQSRAGMDLESERDRAQWDAMVADNAMQLKDQIESGAPLPGYLQTQLDKQQGRREKERELQHWGTVIDKKKSRLKWLKMEARMVELDALIKGHLSLVRANPEHCLRLLDDMYNLQLDPLMLKKHPQVVETIKRLRKYIGNTIEWNFSEEEQLKFSQKATQIRNKAEYVYNKFKAMFTVPEGRTFWQVFSDDVSAFQTKTQHLPIDKVFSLVVDPIFENSQRLGTPRSRKVRSKTEDSDSPPDRDGAESDAVAPGMEQNNEEASDAESEQNEDVQEEDLRLTLSDDEASLNNRDGEQD